MGAGSLTGGIIGGVFAKKIKIKNCSLLLVICSLSILPIALVLSFNLPVITSYVIIMISSFVMMMLATLFSIQLMSCLQMLTPNKLLLSVVSILTVPSLRTVALILAMLLASVVLTPVVSPVLLNQK